MKVLVKTMNIIALLSVMAGGSMLDACVGVGMLIAAPGMAWIGLTAWVNK